MAYTRRGFAQNFWVVKTVVCYSGGLGDTVNTSVYIRGHRILSPFVHDGSILILILYFRLVTGISEYDMYLSMICIKV